MSDLPSFDELRSLADKDPEALSRLRHQACQALIASSPPKYQQRLQAVQCRVNNELRRAKTPMAGLLRISSMMYDSLLKMNESIQALNTPLDDQPPPKPLAEVIDFKRWRQDHRAH